MTKFTKFLSYLLVFVMLGVRSPLARQNQPPPKSRQNPPKQRRKHQPKLLLRKRPLLFLKNSLSVRIYPPPPRLRPPSWLHTANSLKNSARSIPIQPMTPMSQR